MQRNITTDNCHCISNATEPSIIEKLKEKKKQKEKKMAEKKIYDECMIYEICPYCGLDLITKKHPWSIKKFLFGSIKDWSLDCPKHGELKWGCYYPDM